MGVIWARVYGMVGISARVSFKESRRSCRDFHSEGRPAVSDCRARRQQGRRALNLNREDFMSEYIPSPTDWVREQVERYEASGGTETTTLRDTGLPVIIVTQPRQSHRRRSQDAPDAREGRRQLHTRRRPSAARRRTPCGCTTFAPIRRLRFRDGTEVYAMRVREVEEGPERARLWKLAAAAYPPYDEMQQRTPRRIPVFLAEPA